MISSRAPISHRNYPHCVRWYVAYPLSTRHVESSHVRRGVHVDHSTVNRWVIRYSPPLEDALHRCKWPVQVSWRNGRDLSQVKGEWCYLYRAIDSRAKRLTFCSRSNGIRSSLTVSAVGDSPPWCAGEDYALTAVTPTKRHKRHKTSTGPTSSSGR